MTPPNYMRVMIDRGPIDKGPLTPVRYVHAWVGPGVSKGDYANAVYWRFKYDVGDSVDAMNHVHAASLRHPGRGGLPSDVCGSMKVLMLDAYQEWARACRRKSEQAKDKLS